MYFMQWAERARPHLVGAEEASLLGMMDLEHDNLRAALMWYIAKGDAEGALQLTNAMGSFWQYRSYFSEGRIWVSQALDLGFARLQSNVSQSEAKGDQSKRRVLKSLIARAQHECRVPCYAPGRLQRSASVVYPKS